MHYHKYKSITLILAIILGTFGAHKFYLGKIVPGVLYLLFSWTFIPLFLTIIDIIIIALMSQNHFDYTYNS